MKTIAVIVYVALFAFTTLVLVADGPPRGLPFVILTILALLVPLFSALALLRRRGSALLRISAMIGNAALLGLAVWAVLNQAPRPGEKGVVAYTVLLVLAPLLGLAVLFRAGRR